MVLCKCWKFNSTEGETILRAETWLCHATDLLHDKAKAPNIIHIYLLSFPHVHRRRSYFLGMWCRNLTVSVVSVGKSI